MVCVFHRCSYSPLCSSWFVYGFSKLFFSHVLFHIPVRTHSRVSTIYILALHSPQVLFRLDSLMAPAFLSRTWFLRRNLLAYCRSIPFVCHNMALSLMPAIVRTVPRRSYLPLPQLPRLPAVPRCRLPFTHGWRATAPLYSS